MNVRVCRTTISACALFLLAGCATPAGIMPLATYNPATDARIRVDNGSGQMWLFPNQTCTQVDVPRRILGVTHFPSTKTAYNPALTKIVDIGMPKPDQLHGPTYNELVIQAGQPLTIMGSQEYFNGDTNPLDNSIDACGPVFTTLDPKPGHDYEVFMPVAGNCALFLRELKTEVGMVKAIPVAPASGALQCNSRRIEFLR